MNEILNKISSYNIFTYLFPGILFAFLMDEFTESSFLQKDILIAVFLYYFLGLIVSRFGSLVIEPLLVRCKFIQKAKYKDFILACQKDEKVELLSEVNNMYRNLCSMIILLIIIFLYLKLEILFPCFMMYRIAILTLSLLIMFLFSYKKQTKYIKERVNLNKGRE